MPSKPASSIADPRRGYSHLTYPLRLNFLPVIRHATLCCKMLRARFIRGVRTHVSALKSNTACTAALKNILETFGSVPSWLRILVIRTQLFLDFHRFPDTDGQLSSPSIITLPRYLNDVMVSNGSP